MRNGFECESGRKCGTFFGKSGFSRCLFLYIGLDSSQIEGPTPQICENIENPILDGRSEEYGDSHSDDQGGKYIYTTLSRKVFQVVTKARLDRLLNAGAQGCRLVNEKLVVLYDRFRRVIISQRWGFSPSLIYGPSFFDGPGCSQGAAKAAGVVKILVEVFSPKSVFDVGCGSGFYLKEFAANGVLSLGCEGSTEGVKRCPPEAFVFQWDLRRPLIMSSKFDLVCCFEVSEHLPKKAAPVLATSVADLAWRHIVFSASPPGATGDDHINCQPAEYWTALFRSCGFVFQPTLTDQLRQRFAKIGAPDWLRFHTVVYEKICLPNNPLLVQESEI